MPIRAAISPSDPLRLQADIADEDIAGVLYSTRLAVPETTSPFMANHVLARMYSLDAWAAVKADRSKVANAVKEILRERPPVVGWRRKGHTATTLGGVDLPAGAEVQLLTGGLRKLRRRQHQSQLQRLDLLR